MELFANRVEDFYAIILMDVNMPGMDGLTATREIRALERPDTAAVPILAMTASTFQEDRNRAAVCGMNGFLPKPFDVVQLYQMLQDSLNKAAENRNP